MEVEEEEEEEKALELVDEKKREKRGVYGVIIQKQPPTKNSLSPFPFTLIIAVSKNQVMMERFCFAAQAVDELLINI